MFKMKYHLLLAAILSIFVSINANPLPYEILSDSMQLSTVDRFYEGKYNGKVMYVYGENGNISETLNFYSELTKPPRPYKNTYDSNNVLLETQIFDTSGVSTLKRSYTYNNGLLIEQKGYMKSTLGQWEVDSKFEYKYNANLKISESIRSFWLKQYPDSIKSWLLIRRELYAYDANANMITRESFSRDVQFNFWKEPSLFTYRENDISDGSIAFPLKIRLIEDRRDLNGKLLGRYEWVLFYENRIAIPTTIAPQSMRSIVRFTLPAYSQPLNSYDIFGRRLPALQGPERKFRFSIQNDKKKIGYK